MADSDSIPSPRRTACGAISMLYDKARANLAPKELRDLTILSDVAQRQARLMSEVLEGVACLVMDDGQAGPSVGSFQDAEELFPLLVNTAHQFEVIAGLIEIGSRAQQALHEIEIEAARKDSPSGALDEESIPF